MVIRKTLQEEPPDRVRWSLRSVGRGTGLSRASKHSFPEAFNTQSVSDPETAAQAYIDQKNIGGQSITRGSRVEPDRIFALVQRFRRSWFRGILRLARVASAPEQRASLRRADRPGCVALE